MQTFSHFFGSFTTRRRAVECLTVLKNAFKHCFLLKDAENEFELIPHFPPNELCGKLILAACP